MNRSVRWVGLYFVCWLVCVTIAALFSESVQLVRPWTYVAGGAAAIIGAVVATLIDVVIEAER